jgi:steroid delta-isomerase
MSMSAQAHLARYCEFFAGLSPEDLARLADYFAADAHFKDPFNDVRGLAAVRAVFTHMFAVTEDPQFVILEQALSGSTGFVRWRFRFAPRGRPQAVREIEGVSRILFGADGRVVEHVDYWDPVEGLYDGVPLLGWVLRTVRRRLGAGFQELSHSATRHDQSSHRKSSEAHDGRSGISEPRPVLRSSREFRGRHRAGHDPL